MAQQQPAIDGGKSRIRRKVEACRHDGAVVSEDHQKSEEQVNCGREHRSCGIAQPSSFLPVVEFKQCEHIDAQHQRFRPRCEPAENGEEEKQDHNSKSVLPIARQEWTQHLLSDRSASTSTLSTNAFGHDVSQPRMAKKKSKTTIRSPFCR